MAPVMKVLNLASKTLPCCFCRPAGRSAALQLGRRGVSEAPPCRSMRCSSKNNAVKDLAVFQFVLEFSEPDGTTSNERRRHW